MKSKKGQNQLDASTVIQSLREQREACTVGYGERFPESDAPELVVEDNNSATGIRHANQSSEVAYDITTFGAGVLGVKRFLSVLQAAGLDPCCDYIRLYRDLGRGVDTDYQDHFLHAWINDDILVACSNNPVTGEGCSENHCGQKGKAGYIGVGGDGQLVEKTTSKIDAYSNSKDKQEGRLFF
ncbi:hypothetical protein [Haloarcula sp. K1]|uniref:hypothetical protein n=1 Tax=Haloarcula sp. K1 TaxID=1622207 RepID=UPI0007BB59DA|nr:hypothetical protein [Haloarcula sp. K1]KZX46331.1 hypothetical protein AV929_16300 [Haloarcula sp. K1]